MNRPVATAFAALFLVAGCGSGAPLKPTVSFPPWLTSAPASSYLSESSSAADVSLPADGEYICISKELAICRDQGGEATAIALTNAEATSVTPTSGVTDFDPTLSMTAGTVYFRQSEQTATSTIETIQRVSVDGGASTTIATAPGQSGDENTGLGSPQISPDGRFLAYSITVGQVNLPSSAIPAPTAIYAPLGSHILILDVGKGATEPAVVSSTITGAELPDAYDGYQVVGWSPDDRQLYYFGGPSRELRALTFNAAGHPLASNSVVQPAASPRPCPNSPALTAMSPNGDVYFVTYCQEAAVTVDWVHNGHLSAFASVPELTGGWITEDLHIDTTGRYLQLDAVPLGTNCLGGSAHVALLDGVVIAKQIQTNAYGCPPPTRP